MGSVAFGTSRVARSFRRRGAATVLAATLFLAICGLRLVVPNPQDVPFLLFIVPIGLIASDFTVVGGIAAGAVAVGVIAAWGRFGSLGFGLAVHLSRALGLLLIGGLLGKVFAQRRQLGQELAGHRDLSVDMHCAVGFDRTFKQINAAWERILGYAPDEILGKPYLDFVHPDDIERTLAQAARLREGEEAVSFRQRFRHRDGSYRWLEWSGRTSIAEQMTYAVTRDVTEQLAAEEALEDAVRLRTQELEDSQLETLQRLALAAEYRDDDTYEHAERVGRGAALLAGLLGLGQDVVEQIRLAAPLHDLGKLAVSDTVLLKRGKLTTEEFAIIKGHVPAGESILAGSRSAVLQLAREIVRTHHERWDGTGYPAGLAGNEIPISGRIVAVIDVFDALTHERPYKAAWPVSEARAELIRLRGQHFDPAVIDVFETLDDEQLASLVFQDPALADAA